MGVLSTTRQAIAADASADVEPAWRKGVAAAAATFGLLATTAATFAAASGGLGRMFRDELLLSVVAVVLLGLGAICALTVTGLLPGKSSSSRRWRARFLAVASTLLVGGLLVGVVAAMLSTGVRHGPGISGDISGGTSPVLTARVSAGGLMASEAVQVEITGSMVSGQPTPAMLYTATMTADPEGTIDRQVRLPLQFGAHRIITARAWSENPPQPCPPAATPPNTEDADDVESEGGCLILSLPAGPSRPVLTAAWTGSGQNRSLRAAAEARGVAPSSTLLVRVADKRGRPLFRAAAGANSTGELHVSAVVRVTARAQRPICVAAGLYERFALAAPVCKGAAGAWLRLSP